MVVVKSTVKLLPDWAGFWEKPTNKPGSTDEAVIVMPFASKHSPSESVVIVFPVLQSVTVDGPALKVKSSSVVKLKTSSGAEVPQLVVAVTVQ